MTNSVKKHIRAISLIELLVVIGIAMLLAGLLVPTFSGIQRAHQLRKGGFMLQDHLKLARQAAIARNVPVTASLCKTGNPPRYNTILLTSVDASGATNHLARPTRLPEAIAISEDDTWSGIMALPEVTISLQGEAVPARQIEFRPSGATSLNPSLEWYLTAFHSRTSETPMDHFITISIDPVTGSLVTYEP